jgi:hypothetical protein
MKFSENQISDLRVLRGESEYSPQTDNSQVIPKPSQPDRFDALNFVKRKRDPLRGEILQHMLPVSRAGHGSMPTCMASEIPPAGPTPSRVVRR